MEFLKKIVGFFSLSMNQPGNFGWFHLMFVGILIISLVGMIFIANMRHSEKSLRTVLFVCGGIMILFEIYKQLVFTFRLDGGNLVVDYQWYAFPLQLCSTPMYVMIIAGFLKPGKVRDAFLGYLGLFGLFGGLVVLIYPNDVFTTTIGINIQTMIHHGLQIAVGIYLLVYYRKSFNAWFWLGSFIVFAGFFLLALGLNYLVPLFTTETFNMFYISQYFPNHLPILSVMYANTPYVVFLLAYAFGFCLVASIIYWVAFGINKVCHAIHQSYLQTEKASI
jgi:hypothetical protein